MRSVIIAGLFVLVAAIVSVLLDRYLSRPNPGRLTITEVFAVDILSPVSAIATGLPLTIEWDKGVGLQSNKVPLKWLNIVGLKFSNVGEEPIVWPDVFRTPIDFRIQGMGEILSVALDPNPDSAGVRINRRPGAGVFSLTADFLNSGESFDIMVFHTSDKGPSLSVSGRVFGHPPLAIESIVDGKGNKRPWYLPIGFTIVFVVGSVVIFVICVLLLERGRLAQSRGLNENCS